MKLLSGRFRLGANFWSRHAGPRTWSRVPHADLVTELAHAKSMGLDLLRVFAFIPDFVDGDEIVDAPVAHLRAFADEATKLGVALLPSPLVGHMSGENFHLAGGDPLATAQVMTQARLVDAIASALDGAPSVVGYALTNEAPLWIGIHEGRRPLAKDILAWADRILAAARGAHASVPVGLGDGQMDHFPNDEIAGRVDFIGPHLYYGDVDPIRQGHAFDYALALAERFGKPLVFEEFGGSSTQAGAREQAALWSEAIFAAFTAGAHAAIGWCWSDFPVDTCGLELPYVHHAFELGFGLVNAHGEDKASASTIGAWRQLVDSLPDAAPVPAPPSTIIVHSSWIERAYPFSWFDSGAASLRERTAYSLALQAGCDAVLRDEGKALDAQLILVPSTQRLLVTTWLELEARARAGATVYWSYHGGDHLFHQGAWCANFEQLTGCRHRLRYGCFDAPPPLLTLDGVLAELAPLPTGIANARGAERASLAYLPIEASAADVLSRDQDGRPMLVEHRLGRGRVLFCAAPLEQYAAMQPDATQRGLAALYRFLATRAGLTDLLELRANDIADAERLTIKSLSVGGHALIAVMNRSWEVARLPASLQRTPRWSYAPLGAAAPGTLGPKHAIILDA